VNLTIDARACFKSIEAKWQGPGMCKRETESVYELKLEYPAHVGRTETRQHTCEAARQLLERDVRLDVHSLLEGYIYAVTTPCILQLGAPI
jgi:uncharacterized protein YjbK